MKIYLFFAFIFTVYGQHFRPSNPLSIKNNSTVNKVNPIIIQPGIPKIKLTTGNKTLVNKDSLFHTPEKLENWKIYSFCTTGSILNRVKLANIYKITFQVIPEQSEYYCYTKYIINSNLQKKVFILNIKGFLNIEKEGCKDVIEKDFLYRPFQSIYEDDKVEKATIEFFKPDIKEILNHYRNATYLINKLIFSRCVKYHEVMFGQKEFFKFYHIDLILEI